MVQESGATSAGAFGFWKMRAWMWPWSGLYAAQVALGMLIWSLLDSRGSLITGVIAMAVLLVPTVALFRAKARFDSPLCDPASIVEHESNGT